MKIALITGSAGLVGSECVEFLSPHFDRVIGIDNNFRKFYFGEEASTAWVRQKLENQIPNYRHIVRDIRDKEEIERVFSEYSTDIQLIVHAAAQPSHDWAAKDPRMDFEVNALGTLNMLEFYRRHCPQAVFLFTSTNKVYGDTPNGLPLEEKEMRWEIRQDHAFFDRGIDESMTVDQSKHSLFGASKLSADMLVQEYGRYFGLNTGVFRCGCITGPKHSGTQSHGFLSYLMRCAVADRSYTIFGYQGKQVRDNIHSQDLVRMFWDFYKTPKPGAVYNAGGGRFSNCSILEAIEICQELTGRKMKTSYSEEARVGDHLWWISDMTKFKKDFPIWEPQFGIRDILSQIHAQTNQTA